MRHTFIPVLLILSSFFCENAFADETSTKHVLRSRFLVHGEQEIAHNGELTLTYVLHDDVGASSSSIVMAGYKTYAWQKIPLEAALGWGGVHDEPIVELSIFPRTPTMWGNLTLETRLKSMHGYVFAQGEYAAKPWFSVGVETESWGEFAHMSEWTIRSGPNVIARINRLQTDMAIHASLIDGTWSPEIAVRVHLFF